MKLLIVDDNPDMRSILRKICNEHFSEIYECEDGIESIDAYKKQQPDWVLMDIKMDRMDGIKATEEIKTRYPDAKIIIVSQYDDKRIIEASMKSGAKDFVKKDDLTKIEEIIRRNSA
jgi:two-component system, NarL family, response regulator DegU